MCRPQLVLPSLGVNTRQKFGAKIQRMRIYQGVSQERLSEMTEIGVQHISAIENGKKEPCLNIIEKLAKSLGVTMSELLKDL